MKYLGAEGLNPDSKVRVGSLAIYLHVGPLPSLQDGCCFVLIPVDV